MVPEQAQAPAPEKARIDNNKLNSRFVTSTMDFRSTHNARLRLSKEAKIFTATLYAVVLLDERLLSRYFFFSEVTSQCKKM